MRQRVKLLQVAKAAGVSLATVDRVINNRGGVSPAREARVLEAAHSLKLERVAFRKPLRAVRVAFVMASPENPFYVELAQAVARETEAVAHLNIASFVYFFSPVAPDAIVSRLKGLERGYDAVVVTAPADERVSAVLRDVAAKVLLVTFLNDIPDSGRLAYFGPDDERAGRVAGELMGRFLGAQPGEILYMTGFRSMQNQAARERGFCGVLAERFPSCRIAAVRESQDLPNRPGEIVLEELTRNPAIRGIYNTSSGSRSVANAIKRFRSKERPIYLTHELTPERRRLLREGWIDALIDQNRIAAARSVLQFIAHHFGRAESPKQEAVTPFEIFLRENC